MTDPDEQATRRAHMVDQDLAHRGIRDPAVLAAMGAVPREAFLPEVLADDAYDDCALPIEDGQTISQPYIVAAMAEAAELGPGDRVLEVGTGSGYGAAVLRELADQVVTIERYPGLARSAAANLAILGLTDVVVVEGDGSLGWPEGGPYDAIVVTAASPTVPPALVQQLADGGRLIIPVGARHGAQQLIRVRRAGTTLTEDDLGPVAFVPLVGEQGW
jgi:protein-L-isoaspartate(D-aspartate) O-methyltransferase